MFKFYLIFLFSLIYAQTDINREDIEEFTSSKSELNKLLSKDDSNIEGHNIPKFEYEELYESTPLDTINPYFGYDYFMHNQRLLNMDNLPVPNDYILGPGDELVISIWGEIQSYKLYSIDRDGNVFIDDLGQIQLSGYSIAEAKNILYKKYITIYASLKGKNPTTFYDLTLGKLKSININIIGEVNNPGYYSIHPFSSITMSLILNGGVKTTGSLRDIQLIRNGQIITNFDFYNNIVKGKNLEDFQLKNNDIVYVPYRLSSIEIIGAVTKPAIFELKNNENLTDLFNFCGGMDVNATGKIEINRVLSFKDRKGHDNAYQGYIIDYDDIENFHLVDGDIVTIKEITENNNYVIINGQIKIPGEYPYFKELTLLELLKIAGGINDVTYRKSMSIDNVEIVRIDENNDFPDIRIIDVNMILDNTIDDIFLHNLDYISVKKNPNFKEPEMIYIKGEVNSPGYYAIDNNFNTISTIINKADGLTDMAYEDGIRMYRDSTQVILKSGLEVKVLDGDEIVVPKLSGTISVQGEVHNPGLVQYIKNKSLKYYIKSAGGFNKDSNKNNVTIIYANGDISIKTTWNNPSIRDGCSIVVHKKEETIPIDKTQLITNIASIITSLSTMIFIIDNNGN